MTTARRWMAGLGLALLYGCTPVSRTLVHDKLDAGTGSTVTVLTQPLALLTPAGNGGVRTAQFAYLAPFETDRMGAHTLLLWVLVPDDLPAAVPPEIRCDEKNLHLQAHPGGADELALSESPYALPYAWSRQWYLELTDAALGCLARAQHIAVVIPGNGTDAAKFLVDRPPKAAGFPDLEAFAAHRGI